MIDLILSYAVPTYDFACAAALRTLLDEPVSVPSGSPSVEVIRPEVVPSVSRTWRRLRRVALLVLAG